MSGARKCTEGAQRSFARAYLEGVQTGLGLSSSENFFSEKANAGAPQPLRARLFSSDNTVGALYGRLGCARDTPPLTLAGFAAATCGRARGRHRAHLLNLFFKDGGLSSSRPRDRKQS